MDRELFGSIYLKIEDERLEILSEIRDDSLELLGGLGLHLE